VAAELVETTRLFARCVAGIDPKWLEDIGAHLIRRERQNPHWEKSRGQVIASSAARFTGCRCISTGGCTFGPLDPKLARDIFIQSALVEGALETRAPFLAHNRRLWPKSSVSSTSRAAGHPGRRRADPCVLRRAHTAGASQGADFEQLAQAQAERAQPKLLHLCARRAHASRGGGHHHARISRTTLELGPTVRARVPLRAGSARDGVTMTVPLPLLNQVPAARANGWFPGC
jgi:ATP-dependent helicase HrpA